MPRSFLTFRHSSAPNNCVRMRLPQYCCAVDAASPDSPPCLLQRCQVYCLCLESFSVIRLALRRTTSAAYIIWTLPSSPSTFRRQFESLCEDNLKAFGSPYEQRSSPLPGRRRAPRGAQRLAAGCTASEPLHTRGHSSRPRPRSIADLQL